MIDDMTLNEKSSNVTTIFGDEMKIMLLIEDETCAEYVVFRFRDSNGSPIASLFNAYRGVLKPNTNNPKRIEYDRERKIMKRYNKLWKY